MTDTTAQHMVARDDKDLVARLIAAAEQAHIPNPKGFVTAQIGKLISTDLGSGVTLTSVYSYAAAVRADAVAALPPAPGLNPSAVLDSQLSVAISLVWEAEPVV